MNAFKPSGSPSDRQSSTVGRWLGLSAVVALTLPAALGAQPAPNLGTEAQQAAGKVNYDKYCAQCHGDTGDGQGIATPYLRPEPRDFTSGKYKFRSTPNGTLPSDDDIRRVIVQGVPFSGMPGFPGLSDNEVQDLIFYLKTFSSDFEDPSAYADPLPLPSPPSGDSLDLEAAFQVYDEIGCGQCHGAKGRGDGATAPTLRDDWGNFIRVADLTQPWTFRAGATREDMFRSISTGFNGTPMAGFADGLTEDQRWAIVDWMVAQAGGSTAAPYGTLVTAAGAEEEIELTGDMTADREIFANAENTMFPVIGQIVQPGRQFRPAVLSVQVQSVFDRDEIFFLVRWNDMKQELTGSNSPDMVVPTFEEETEALKALAAEQAASSSADDDPFAAPSDDGGGFWDAPADDGADEATVDLWTLGTDEFSDAVALQFPATQPEGIIKPYFIFGDPQNPVELWFVDLARQVGEMWVGRGSDNVIPGDSRAPEVSVSFDEGEWSVIFRQPRTPSSGARFEEGQFTPIAVSVWDGFQRERGNKRGLTSWYHVYLEPRERVSPVGPMAKTALAVFGLELLLIGFVRFRKRKTTSPD